MREVTVEEHLVARAKELGGVALKVRVLGMAGFPDRLVIIPRDGVRPCIGLCETKRPKGGRIHHRQYAWERLFIRLRVPHAFCKTLEEVDQFLERLTY